MGRFTTWSRGERTRGLVAVLVAVVLAAFVGSAAAQSIEEGYVPGGDGVALNHQKHGDGPPDLIVTNQVSVAVPLSGLAGEWTVVFYDTRGRGLSTPIWDPALLGMDQEIADISAVHERYGGEPATVLGGSLWGGFAQLYAARHPGRVRGVIAFGPIEPAGIEANGATVPDARVVVVDDSGHMGFVEHPERCVEIVDAFLASLP